jgi:protein-S-isoprenylcysteine O-methyltransferase Ste14
LGYTSFNHAWVYLKIETMTRGMVMADYLWGAFFLLLILAALRTKKTQQRENVASRLSYTVIIALGLALMFWVNVGVGPLDVRWLPQFDAGEMAGIAIIIVGLTFAVWARLHLKSNWSGTVTVKQDHQLIRSGPYRWVRHPIYSGVILALAGTAVENGRLTGILGVLLVFIGFWIKSRKEEQFMRQAFGEQYEVYCQSTGALIPRL